MKQNQIACIIIFCLSIISACYINHELKQLYRPPLKPYTILLPNICAENQSAETINDAEGNSKQNQELGIPDCLTLKCGEICKASGNEFREMGILLGEWFCDCIMPDGVITGRHFDQTELDECYA